MATLRSACNVLAVFLLLLTHLCAIEVFETQEHNNNNNNALDANQDVQLTAAADTPAINARQYPTYGGCPLCDASVYSYCSHKVIHDSCCCDFPVVQLKPPQCFYFDCALLYAKSCYEHSLIKNCCCNNPY